MFFAGFMEQSLKSIKTTLPTWKSKTGKKVSRHRGIKDSLISNLTELLFKSKKVINNLNSKMSLIIINLLLHHLRRFPHLFDFPVNNFWFYVLTNSRRFLEKWAATRSVIKHFTKLNNINSFGKKIIVEKWPTTDNH